MAMTHEKEDHEPSLEFGGALGAGPRETVADLVRRAREDFGQDLRSVADVLRIRPAYLEAIESGDFDSLPGTTYAIGFLRTYAEYLGLDGEDMVERFKAETQAAARRSELIFPEPVAEGRIPGGAIILVSMALLAVAYGGWFYLSQQGRTVADLIPAWPTDSQTAESGEGQAPAKPASEAPSETADKPAEEAGIVTTSSAQASTAEVASPAPVAEAPAQIEPVQAAAAPEPQAETAPEPQAETATEPQAETAPEPQAEQTPGPDPVSTPETTAAPMATTTPVERASVPPQPVAESQAPAGEATTLATLVDQTVVIPAPPSTPETVIIPDDRSPRAYGGSNDKSRIVIRAVQDSWVQVRDSQEAILLTRVLRAGDSYRVPDVAGLTLLTGNAGGIELEVDGVRLPPAGPPGSVRRSISLDPAQLLSGTSANR